MPSSINFTPGPSQLYFTVPDHVREAFKTGIPSLSHRSKAFQGIYQFAADGLRELLQLPDDYGIYFTGSANEIWERIGQSLVSKQSFHLINGAFSQRFEEIVRETGKQTESVVLNAGSSISEVPTISDETDLIALTQNETSTGVSLPLEQIAQIRSRYPDKLIAVDAVSSLPYINLDYSKIDTAFFSIQKGFGLPAGLGVWLANKKCIERTKKNQALGNKTGTYHSLLTLDTFAAKFQTPETPNVLAIYLLGKVIEDFNRRGIKTIRNETLYKSTLLYQCLSTHSLVNPFVKAKAWQSQTVIVAECAEGLERLVSYLQGAGIDPGEGYGAAKKTQLRFANFPAHSKEQFEWLVDKINLYH